MRGGSSVGGGKLRGGSGGSEVRGHLGVGGRVILFLGVGFLKSQFSMLLFVKPPIAELYVRLRTFRPYMHRDAVSASLFLTTSHSAHRPQELSDIAAPSLRPRTAAPATLMCSSIVPDPRFSSSSLPVHTPATPLPGSRCHSQGRSVCRVRRCQSLV